MSAAAAAGGGGGGGGGGGAPPLSNIQIIQEVQDLLVNSDDKDQTRLREKINRVSEILLADPDRECQAQGRALRVSSDYEIKSICEAVENLKMSQNLKNLLQELLEVETNENLRTEDQKKARIGELIREIRKEYQGDILLLPPLGGVHFLGLLHKELLKQCGKYLATQIANYALAYPSFFGEEKMEIFKLSIRQGADLTKIPKGGEKPSIILLFEDIIKHVNPTDFPMLEEIFASGIVVPPPGLGVQLLELSFQTTTSNSTLETFLPGLRNALVDYGADLDAFLAEKIGKEELERLKAVVASKDPDEIKQENRPNYPDYIALLKRRAEKKIYANALANVQGTLGPQIQEGIAPTYAGAAAGFPQDISDIISRFAVDVDPRKVGLECQNLRNLERGGQESDKKDEAAQTGRGGGGGGASKSKDGAAAT